MEKEGNTERGIATARQLEKRLSSIALGRIKKPDEAKITEQLKAIELLVKIRGMAEEEKAHGSEDPCAGCLGEGDRVPWSLK